MARTKATPRRNYRRAAPTAKRNYRRNGRMTSRVSKPFTYVRSQNPKYKRAMRKLNSRPISKAPAGMSKGNNSAHQHFSVISNPFSKATSQPKIPDGKIPTSLSRRLQHVSEMSNKLNGDGIIDVLLHPGFGTGMVAYGTNNMVGTRNYEPFGFASQTVGFDATQLAESTGGGGAGSVMFNAGISHWRTVSQAVRFDLANSGEENDGWWEAARITPKKQPNFYDICPITGSASLASCALVPNHSYMTQILSGQSMVEEAGYTTGLLKDLKGEEFKLQPIGCECKFQETKSSYRVESSDVFVHSNNMNVNIVKTDPTNGVQDMLEDFLGHSSHDWCHIRFHCRANTGLANSNGSKLLVHLIQNQEFSFGPTSDLKSFQTDNNPDKRTNDVINRSADTNQANAKRNKSGG